MNETMMLPVEHLGTAYEFPLTIVMLGYTYRLHVEIEGTILIFEMDDQQQYRVLSRSGRQEKVSKGLVEAIVSTLQSV